MVHVRVSSKATILTSEQQLKQLQKSLKKKKHQASTGLNPRLPKARWALSPTEP